MRLVTLRAAAILVWAIAAGVTASPPAAAQAVLSEGAPIASRTRAIETFRIGAPESTFGKLTFLGGLELIAADRETGGLSGLVSLDGGAGFLAVTDNGHWVAGDIEQAPDGRPLHISNLRFAPLLGSDGRTLKARWGHDTEALAASASGLYVTAETRNAIYRYPWPLSGGHERMLGELALPDDIRALPRNKGLEALAAAPADGPLAGQLVAVAETTASDLEDLKSYLIGSEGAKPFAIRRSDGFDATDAAFLPGGDLLLLERRFTLRDLVGMRLRRFSGSDIRAGAVLDGEVLLEAGFTDQIDNMEGLAVHQDADGATILTLISDNNRSILQRTLLLRFRLDQ